ncbi:MAG: thermostable hemolysin [Gammaproteobacteria bacterium]|nr:thermostable hemolysin [Gammaproteobacteria bacterium]
MNSLIRSAETFAISDSIAQTSSNLGVNSEPQHSVSQGILQLVENAHPQRQNLQQFIAAGFAKHYQANVRQFMPYLLGVSLSGNWQAALGIRFAGSEPLFTEQYLPARAESVLQQLNTGCQRSDIAEIGHLYAQSRQALMQLFVLMLQALHQLHVRHLLFAATADLQRMLKRHGITLSTVAEADPACLGDKARDWGSYYDKQPQVCVLTVSQAAERIQSDARLQQLIFRHWPQLHSLVATLQDTL